MNFNFKNIFSNIKNVIVIVKSIDDPPSQPPKSVRLNLSDNLLAIRKELERDSSINDTLLFSKKYPEINNNYGFAEIAFEKEDDFLLDDIIDEVGSEKILYLKKCSKLDWNYFNELRKLDYGRTITSKGIKRANKRAFQMKNCELTELGAEGCQKGDVKIKSNEELMMRTNLFFSGDIKVQNLVELGISIEKLKNEKFNIETDSSYCFTEYGKISLEFSNYLDPTPEFIKVVKEAIKSKNIEDFKQITEEFGQFIPTEVILGGRAYFDDFGISTGYFTENSNEDAMNANTGGVEVSVASSSNYSKGKSNYFKSQCTKLIGGEQSSLENFDEENWVKSLKDYKTWDCIEFRGPISIFQILPKDLLEQIIKSIGKRIHYATTEDFNYYLERIERPKKFELNIPLNISKIIQNKAADCNIFATVIDTAESKNDFFTCQVLCPPDGKPSLIIHCIQKKSRKRECKLKINWMIIGFHTNFKFILSDFNTQLNIIKNDFDLLNNQNLMINTNLLDFKYDSLIGDIPCFGIPVLTKLDSSNSSLVIGHHFFNAQEENKIGACTFSYCLKNNRYVNLPNFTLYTLIISAHYHIHNASYIMPFDYSTFKNKPIINLTNNNTCLSPKFISLYSTEKTNCGPIFLKQKIRQIKIKSIDCKNSNCFICKNNTLITTKNNIKCAFFDPDQYNNLDVDSNEAMRCEYISTILHTAVSLLDGLVLCNQKNYQRNVGGNNLRNRGKQNQPTVSIYQNLLQCRSACDVSITNSATPLATG
ncbi:hypothetical protein RhiirA4_547598 [Rhizophagus irregularis]|uniref:DUF7431 domain-containing protein n=1 Tax=Rhizophagus irregularis TaxID=588596 RepID=A0A2I1H359_9GLOM|nr:hypothetical protein RhiirA4_547598 [Rhizophagus irregularis]